MMKVATILPQTYLAVTEDDKYLMSLAHLINKPGMEEYTNFFTRKAKQEGTFLIMDNGLIEGDPRPIEELLQKALDVGAHELILPDVFRDSRGTLQAVEKASKYLEKQFGDDWPVGFMAVPQGETLEQWLSCAIMLLDNPVVSCIGVPKVLVDIAGRDGRLRAIQELANRTGDIGGRALHLLGCWRTPLEVSIIAKAVEQEKIPEIRGVDSAIPYVYARAGIKINDDDRPDSEPIDFEDGTIEDEALMCYNILFWRDCVDMRADKEMFLI